MTAAITTDNQERARHLAGTIREALVYLADRESPEIRNMLPEALDAVEQAVPDSRSVRLAGDAIRQLLRHAAHHQPDRLATLSRLDRYDQALSEALTPRPAVKLVIWDLDDTFWRGTLAEGDTLVIPPAHVAMVRELTRRGIVNAICSKNDFAAARQRLEQAGIWDQFVFPHIAFAPKGQLIKEIIEQAQLRAENVLFIDDNPQNLEEAHFYNAGLQTLDAQELPNLLHRPELKGKPDGGARLAQYKLLEQRVQERMTASSNEAFLRQSDIHVRITSTAPHDAERVHDMLTRTNQLNFTKQRLTLEEVGTLIADPARTTATVSVRDRFGDHGVIGWYCLQGHTLEHFLFSCRIINLGIEQWVYAHLGRPKLDVVGETASSPFDSDVPLDYITLDTASPTANAPTTLQADPVAHRKLRIFASGACDMYYLVGTLANALTDVTFECNTFRGNARGVNVATEYLRSCFEMSDDDKAFCRQHFHNYTGQGAFQTQLFNGQHDYALFSFNDDAELFIHQKRDQDQLRVVLSESATYSVTPVMPPEGQDADKWLCEHFDSLGLITPERFRENLCWIADRMPAHTRILLMTLPEFNYFRNALPSFPQYRRQCLRLNRVIRSLCAEDPRFGLIEMNRYITDRQHFTDYVMHLRPEQGFFIACEALHRMAQRPLATDLMGPLPLRGRQVALLGKGLETLPYRLTLEAAGVEVALCAAQSPWADQGLAHGTPPVPLSQVAGQADKLFAIVTPQLAASPGSLASLGYTRPEDCWILPDSAFNLDWKER
ncbi:HAD family hydrolase [Aquabacterium sp.]|uniref:HAD family hydrolase n=1 Tax=Aquabacterium sp. TaxID=1872578 RepID=UPI0025BC9C0C|nr:HAD family hydrolase [Aquabacterium sp.]